jgi:hypothetical protein
MQWLEADIEKQIRLGCMEMRIVATYKNFLLRKLSAGI